MTLSGMTATATTQALRRLAQKNVTARLKRGLWLNRFAHGVHPYEAVPYLTAPWPSYVSLYSALAEHGTIEEIPQITYAVSPGTPSQHRTDIGAFSVHHLPRRLIWGYEMRRSGEASFPLAEPEKAFLDLVYLALSPRSPLEFPYKRDKRWKFDRKKLAAYAKKFDSPMLSNVLKREELL